MNYKLLLLGCFLYVSYVESHKITIKIANPIINNIAIETFIKFFEDQDFETQEKLLSDFEQQCAIIKQEIRQLKNKSRKWHMGFIASFLSFFAAIPGLTICNEYLPASVTDSKAFRILSLSSVFSSLLLAFIFAFVKSGYTAQENKKGKLYKTMRQLYDLCAFKHTIRHDS